VIQEQDRLSPIRTRVTARAKTSGKIRAESEWARKTTGGARTKSTGGKPVHARDAQTEKETAGQQLALGSRCTNRVQETKQARKSGSQRRARRRTETTSAWWKRWATQGRDGQAAARTTPCRRGGAVEQKTRLGGESRTTQNKIMRRWILDMETENPKQTSKPGVLRQNQDREQCSDVWTSEWKQGNLTTDENETGVVGSGRPRQTSSGKRN
jgi:hypothetical protein